jgi:hypothetical protein
MFASAGAAFGIASASTNSCTAPTVGGSGLPIHLEPAPADANPAIHPPLLDVKAGIHKSSEHSD